MHLLSVVDPFKAFTFVGDGKYISHMSLFSVSIQCLTFC